eukprot:s202_g31.t1
MVLGAADAGVTGTLSNVTATKEMLEPMEAGNFLHCPCGIDCQTDLGKEHGFQLQQGCSCTSCALRGSAVPAPGAAGNVSAAELLAMMAEEQEWDAASVPGDSQLLFCRCGVLTGACRSCEETQTRSSSRHGLTCPCGARCLRRLQWFGGNGWCVKRACIPCR